MTADHYKGIPREEIRWFPTILKDKCNGCGVCVSFCHQGVYTDGDDGPVVKNPFKCVVGCTGCAGQCPSEAIRFPTLVGLRDELAMLRKKYSVLRGGTP